MPNETADYVPKLQAVKNIVKDPNAFGLTLPELYNHPYFLAVPIERDIDVALAVQLSSMDSDEFQALNPQLNRPVILAAGTPQILLPYDNANDFVRALPKHRGPLATWTAWSVPRTMKAAEAAQLVGMSEPVLRQVNQVPAGMLIRGGSTLLVPRVHAQGRDVPGEVADNATLAFAPDTPPTRRVRLQAGRRDTVASVARRYRVSPAQVAQWNDTTPGAAFKPGQTVFVHVPQRVRGSAVATTPRGVPAVASATLRGTGKVEPRKAAAVSRSAKDGRADRADPARSRSAKARTASATVRAAAKPDRRPSARAGGPRSAAPAARPTRAARQPR